MNANPNRRNYYPASELRLERLRAGVKLADLASAAGLSLTRASEIERFPGRGSASEIESLRNALAALPSRIAD